MQRLIAVALIATLAGTAGAQGTCPSGRRVPDLGYGFASCHDCVSAIIRNGAHIPRFTGEPALYQIRADGPAAGKLSEGDTLVDVDGLPIATEAAAVRLAEFRPGTMRLTVRRNGASRTVALNPLPVCVGGLPEVTARALDSLARARAAQQYAVGVISRAEYERAMGRHELADSLARVDAEQAYRVGAISREAYERAMGRYGVADSLARDNARLQYRAGMMSREEYERIVREPPRDSAGTMRGSLRLRDSLWGPIEWVVKPGPRRYEIGWLIPSDSTVFTGFFDGSKWRWNYRFDFNVKPFIRDSSGNLVSDANALGVGLACGGCKLERLAGGKTRWAFSTFPLVEGVERSSPAYRAGLRSGDTLRSIDGLSLLTKAGRDRLDSLGPGRKFRLGWVRQGKPQFGSSAIDSLARGRFWIDSPRLSQSVGTAQVEVRGPGATWTRDPRTGELRIRVDSATITVRPRNAPPDSTRPIPPG